MINQELQRIINIDSQTTLAIRGFFANYPVDEFYIRNNSALIIGTSNHRWIHCVGNDKNDLAELLNINHDLSLYYHSVEDWMLPLILKNKEEDWCMETLRFVLDADVPIPEASSVTLILDLSYAEFVHKNSDYKDYTDLAYIRDRLSNDISAAILKDEKPVAWGLTHDDGSLGFLHVLPEHRKRGYARDISNSLIALKRQLGQPVFCNIVPGNTPSINLTERMGFKFDRKVSWVKIRKT
jgi:8-oxo-dGTP diphosphatase